MSLNSVNFNLVKVKIQHINAKEKKLNSILEKISKNGYDSLQQHEKNFLNNYKNNL